MSEDLNEFRCQNCRKLLFKYKIDGELTVEVKCTRCSAVSSLKIKRKGSLRI